MEIRWGSATSAPIIPPGSPGQEMTGQRPEEQRSMRRSTVRSLWLQTKICPLASPPKASRPARYYPSELASPPQFYVAFNHNPWVWPSLSLYSRPTPHRGRLVPPLRISAKLTGTRGGTHSRVREEICQDTTTNLLLCRGRRLPAYFQQRIIPPWLCHGLLRPSPKHCTTPHRRERPALHSDPANQLLDQDIK